MRRRRPRHPVACIAALLAAPLSAEPVLMLETESGGMEVSAAAIAEMDISESGGITDIFLRLMPGASEDLARLTWASIGQPLAVSACGAVLMAPVVRDRIDSGTLYLPGTTMVRAEALRALWHGRASCDTLDPQVFTKEIGHGQ